MSHRFLLFLVYAQWNDNLKNYILHLRGNSNKTKTLNCDFGVETEGKNCYTILRYRNRSFHFLALLANSLTYSDMTSSSRILYRERIYVQYATLSQMKEETGVTKATGESAIGCKYWCQRYFKLLQISVDFIPERPAVEFPVILTFSFHVHWAFIPFRDC